MHAELVDIGVVKKFERRACLTARAVSHGRVVGPLVLSKACRSALGIRIYGTTGLCEVFPSVFDLLQNRISAPFSFSTAPFGNLHSVVFNTIPVKQSCDTNLFATYGAQMSILRTG